MKTIYFIILFALSSSLSFGQGWENEKEWLESYKQLAYFNGLLKGLSDRALSRRLVFIDRSFYNPVFWNLHEKAIEKGGDYLAEMIRRDSVESCITKPGSRKRPIYIVLKFYQSEKLQKMAKEAYVIWMKTPNKKKLIEKASIAY